MRPIRFLPALAFVVALGAPAIAQSQPQTRSATGTPAALREISLSNGFDQWAEALIEEWKVPGIAVGAIKNGEVVLLKGYGWRNAEEKLPVTPQTLMAIGSNSKSFTVVLMGQLVDEGKLDWDAPVQQYLPDFQLWDQYAARKLRVKDLVTHLSGLPRHDDLWYGRHTTRQQIFERLRYLQPSTSFRGRWQYNNLMFITAGHLVETLRGQSWESLVRERIFAPLKMDRSNLSTDDLPGSGDFSYPYSLFGGKVSRVPFRKIDNAGPAGSINSSVEEMLRYVQMHINRGQWDGHRLLSEKNDVKMQSPQSIMSESMDDPELGPRTYGLATMVSSYRGHTWVEHGGGIDGFISQMAWLPNDDIGVVVLSNLSGPNPVQTVVYRVFDDLLGLEPIDWNARAKQAAERGQVRADSVRAKIAGERLAGTSPSHSLQEFAGRYSHPGYGSFEIVVRNGGLVMRYDSFTLPLEHYHYDLFRLDPMKVRGAPFSGLLQFHTNTTGRIDRVGVPFEPAIDPIQFERL